MLLSERVVSTASSKTKTLLYTISFVFLFLFLEYSLNYISSTSYSSFGNIADNDDTKNYEKYKNRYESYEKFEKSKTSLSSGSDTSFASLSSSLIEKEKLLIEKEEKYVVALQKLNERDLKLNYVDEQLYKLQSLLNTYKIHTKNLQTKLGELENKFNNQSMQSKEERRKKKIPQQQDLESLLDQTRKQINKHNNININDKLTNEANNNDNNNININVEHDMSQMVDFRLIFDLGIVLIAATFGAIIAQMCSQPLILGYLLGGSLVGPGGLKLIQQYIQVETLAHIGSIFLLFNVGMQFKFDKMKKYLCLSIFSFGLCCFVLYILCYVWFYLFSNENEFNLINVTIFVFAALNTSTTIVLKTWSDLYAANDNNQSKKIIVAILLFQDIYFIFFMAIFSSATQQQANENFIYKLFIVIIILIIVFTTLPSLLCYLRKLISIDIYILCTVSLCIIFTLITQNVFESSGLGAFTAGLLISKSNPSARDDDDNVDDTQLLKKNWSPIRNIFNVLFFASIGMLINPGFLLINWSHTLSLVLFVGFGKFVMIYLSVYFSQNRNNELALNVSTSLCLQGEFAFVLSAHAHLDKLITMSMHTVLLGATAISILITPFVIRHFAAYFMQIYCWLHADKLQFINFKSFKS